MSDTGAAFCPGCNEPMGLSETICLECGYEPGVSRAHSRKVRAEQARGDSLLTQWILVAGQVFARIGAGWVGLTTIIGVFERWVLLELFSGVAITVLLLALAIVFRRVRDL